MQYFDWLEIILFGGNIFDFHMTSGCDVLLIANELFGSVISSQSNRYNSRNYAINPIKVQATRIYFNSNKTNLQLTSL